MRDRAASLRIDLVREALPILLKIVAVIAGGRHRHRARLDDRLYPLLCASGGFLDRDTPRALLAIMPQGSDLTADIDHIVIDVQRLQIVGHHIDAIPLGDRREIDIQLRNILDQRIAL